jgi:hypothetical protein
MALYNAWDRTRVLAHHEYFDTYTVDGEGTVAVMPHGFGIHKDAKFTVHAIFEQGRAAYTWAEGKYGDDDTELDSEPRSLPPHLFALYNDFYWVGWKSLNNSVGAFVSRRSKMQTPHSFSYTDASDYVGSGQDITKAWDSYIPVAERLHLLTRTCKGLDLDRLNLLSVGCGTGHQLVALAAHGFQVFGIEGNPNVFRDRHYLLRDRIVLGDALQDLYLFTKRSFNIAMISCVGHVWHSDLVDFFMQVAGTVCYGGLVILDVKEYSGRDFRDRKTYRVALAEAGIHVQLRTQEMLIGTVGGPAR